ncbi:polysaccharide deacetylase family protein [Nocardiopsis sp. NPDC058631]|uniref:polysaccharide deacetylase family protein n=1 Tax=Nocardiopsis sp. NPDC058631 TaxID=3346566 RepID=UPI00364CB747
MAVTSLRRNLSVSAALGLLLVPGCQAADQQLPYAEAVRTPVDEMPGLEAETLSVTTDHSVVSYRYPLMGGAPALMTELRTSMAERQTAFLEDLPERGTPELHQDVAVLAASPDVLGVRLTAATSAGTRDTFDARSLWYDVAGKSVLPWTSLFRDEASIEQAHLEVAGILEDEYHLPVQEMPGLVGEVAARARAAEDGGDGTDTDTAAAADGAASSGAGETRAEPHGGRDGAGGPLDLTDPDQALEAAERWAGSPLEDLAFSTAGGLAVRMEAADVPSAGRVDEVMLPVEPENSENLLSELGFHAREAALGAHAADEEFPLGGGLSDDAGALDCERLKCVALTFDDGPGEHTDELLDMLAEYDASATFYVLGSLVDEFPEPVARMAAEGHELGNHTWKHDDLAGLSAEAVKSDIERTNQAVHDVIGSDPPTIRPPYGSLNGRVRETVEQPLILWDVDTLDWQSRDTDAISEHALTNAVPGSVVLFHDIHRTSVQAIPDVLAGLHREGYHFVTVTDIFGDEELAPGRVYTDAQPIGPNGEGGDGDEDREE